MPTAKSRRIFIFSLVFLCVAGVLAGLVVWHKAQRALHDSAAENASASRALFDLVQLRPASTPAGFYSFDIANGFESFTAYDGQIFVCSRTALYRYDSEGQLRQTWRVGQELPPFPLTTLAVRRGIGQPELWIGSNGGGVLLWNGALMRQLTSKDPALRQITALLPLANGRMLLGTLNSGLYVTDTQQHSLFHPEFAHTAVTALAGSGGGEDRIWVGTRDAGVWLWQAGTVSRFSSELPDPQVLSLFSSGPNIWVGTPAGIAEFIDGQFQRRIAEGVFARSLAEDGKVLWISTLDQGTLALNLKSRAPRPAEAIHLAGNSALQSVALLPAAGRVLALSFDSVRALPEGEVVLHAPSGLTADHISALHAEDGRLWVGYFDRGLDILPLADKSAPRHLENDVLFCINRIKRDPATGRVYVATANGLVSFAGSEPRQVMRARDGLIANHVTDLLFRSTSPGASQLVAATPAGLTFIDGGAATSLYAFQGLVNNHVYTLAETPTALIAGTLGGVSALKNGLVLASYTTANSSLRQNWITASATHGDDLYLGTYGSGVVRVDKNFVVQSFREFAGERTEINQNAMLATSRGIYAGTSGRGLAVYSFTDHRWRFLQAGLPSTNVTALEIDGDDLYIGTDNGLVRLPETSLSL